MNIFSAHFAYSKNVGFIKNPLLYVNNNGVVEKLISCGSVYREVHSAQFHSGLLIPGFLVDLSSQFKQMPIDTNWKQKFISLYSKGVRYIVLPSAAAVFFGTEMVNGPSFIYTNTTQAETNKSILIKAPWEEMLSQQPPNAQPTLTEQLHHWLDQPWQPFIKLKTGGEFTSDYTPGVWCISGIDWTQNRLLPSATIKRIA